MVKFYFKAPDAENHRAKISFTSVQLSVSEIPCEGIRSHSSAVIGTRSLPQAINLLLRGKGPEEQGPPLTQHHHVTPHQKADKSEGREVLIYPTRKEGARNYGWGL